MLGVQTWKREADGAIDTLPASSPWQKNTGEGRRAANAFAPMAEAKTHQGWEKDQRKTFVSCKSEETVPGSGQ